MKKDLPTAALLDVDGTLIDTTSVIHHVVGVPKSQRNYRAFHEASVACPAIPMVIEWAREKYAQGHALVIATGRDERFRQVTEDWIQAADLPPITELVMSTDRDPRSSPVVKEELLLDLKTRWNIVAAIDDRPDIIEVWKKHQIPEIVLVPGWSRDHSNEVRE